MLARQSSERLDLSAFRARLQDDPIAPVGQATNDPKA
jgi:hypothetical protein